MRWRVLVPLCGVQTDPLDDGVELCSPDGTGQKLVGIARPIGVEMPVGVGANPAFSEGMLGPNLHGAQGQTFLRHDVPASVGVQTGVAFRGVIVTTLRDATMACTGS